MGATLRRQGHADPGRWHVRHIPGAAAWWHMRRGEEVEDGGANSVALWKSRRDLAKDSRKGRGCAGDTEK